MGTDKNFIKEKKSKAKVKMVEPKESKPQELPPKDLQDLWGAVICLATTHNLLQQHGSFPFAFNNSIGTSLKFLEGLYKDALAKCADHPKKDLIPEIQEKCEKLVAQLAHLGAIEASEVKDGEAKANQ